MKIYTIHIDMLLVLSRLKRFNLYEFNSLEPIIFVEAKDADDACYKMSCRYSEILLKQDESIETALLIRETLTDIKISKVYCKDEKGLQ
jgi:hypothetical protein